LIYFQQGDSQKLAMEKAAITTKAANVAFTASAREMSEMLTAVWNSYQVGEAQLEHVVDVMAKLGATTATSTEEIATAMQKVAATANTVGVSMEQMSSMIATVSSTTRASAESVGTSMQTILSRIGGLKLGETLEDGVNLNKYSKG
jgi:TP901 family phage tail tape measure protein